MTHQIVYVNVKKLTSYEKNPRKIKREDLEVLKKSLEKNPKFFEARPCLVNEFKGKFIVYSNI